MNSKGELINAPAEKPKPPPKLDETLCEIDENEIKVHEDDETAPGLKDIQGIHERYRKKFRSKEDEKKIENFENKNYFKTEPLIDPGLILFKLNNIYQTAKINSEKNSEVIEKIRTAHRAYFDVVDKKSKMSIRKCNSAVEWCYGGMVIMDAVNEGLGEIFEK